MLTSLYEASDMKSIHEISKLPAGISLLADDIIEFHAARLLLLLGLCGINGVSAQAMRRLLC